MTRVNAADVDLREEPAIRIEEGDDVITYRDALDAELAVRDDDVPLSAVVWRQIATKDTDSLFQVEITDDLRQQWFTRASATESTVREATIGVLSELSDDDVDSTGRYLFTCSCGLREECQSVVALRLYMEVHEQDTWSFDDEGWPQIEPGHSSKLWKHCAMIGIRPLADEIRQQTNTDTTLDLALSQRLFADEGFGSGDSTRLQDLLFEGLTTAEALDYHMTVENGCECAEWATERGSSEEVVRNNVRRAKEKLRE